MRYSGALRVAWETLLYDYGSCKFNPEHEADVQAYLYHQCWATLEGRIAAPWILMEHRRGKARYDLRLGRRPLVVEVKWSSPRRRRGIPKSWRRDVKKLRDGRLKGSARRPVFVLFIAPWPSKQVRFSASAVLGDIARLRAYATRKGVDVLSIDKFRWGTVVVPPHGPPERRRWLEQLAKVCK